MGGVDLGRACLRHNPAISILYISGSLPGEELLAELETGHRAFLPQPFQGNDLLRKVKRLLDPRFEREIILASPRLRLNS
jgi:CheY-like chemotaxis protein